MKRIAIIVAALISCVVMSAQDVKVKSKVELKGGKGEIVGYAEKQDDGGYVVETESGDVFYYSVSEIKKITQLEEKEEKVKEEKVKEEKVKEEKVKIVEEKPTYDFSGDRSKTKGYMGIVEAGIGLNSYYCGYSEYGDYHETSYMDPELSLSIINGYRFSPHFYAGVGIGFNNTVNDFSLPLFLHLRSEFTKRRTSPYIALSGGVVLNGGAFLEGALGLRTHLKKHGSLFYGLSVGYVGDDEEDYWFSAILTCFKLAYSF